MRHLTLIAFLFTAAISHAEISQDVGVMGFQAWKASRVEEAKQQLEKIQTEAPVAEKAKPADAKNAKAPQENSRLQKVSRADQKLQQAQLNVEIAQDLNVNDYFVLYLNQFKDRSAFLEAAQKLSSTEAADLMMAYQKHLATAAPEAALPNMPGQATQSEANSVRR